MKVSSIFFEWSWFFRNIYIATPHQNSNVHVEIGHHFVMSGVIKFRTPQLVVSCKLYHFYGIWKGSSFWDLCTNIWSSFDFLRRDFLSGAKGHVFWTNRDEGSSHGELLWRCWWFTLGYAIYFRIAHILSGISSKACPPWNILKPTFFFRLWESRVGRWHVLLRCLFLRGEGMLVLGRVGLPLVLHESCSKNLDSIFGDFSCASLQRIPVHSSPI